MSYIVIKVYSFECDYPGCGTSNHDVNPSRTGLRGAEKELRADGWTVRSGRHFCVNHTATQIALAVMGAS